MESVRTDDYTKELAGALVAGAAAGIATFVSGELAVGISATVTVLASIAGWAVGRLFTHDTQRGANAALAVAVGAAAVVLVAVGARERCAPKGVTCLVGGCDRYSVYSQNRYQPLGAAIRAEPRREGLQVGSAAPNKLLPVDGWVRTAPAYPSNLPPFNGDVWFHLADDSGWVSVAGVRADPTLPAADPADQDAGAPAPTPAECRGTFRSNN